MHKVEVIRYLLVFTVYQLTEMQYVCATVGATFIVEKC